MIELTGENVKQAIVQQLLKTFPNVKVYKEAITNPQYPHFFVYQISFVDTEERKSYHLMSYEMDVRYRIKSDPSTDLKLEQNLDDMGMKLLQNFNIIAFGNEKIRIKEKNTEKVDGVLHFTFNIDILGKEIPDEESVRQNKLKVVIYGKEVQDKG